MAWDIESLKTLKRCLKCGLSKPLDEFTFRKETKTGRYYQCRKCTKEKFHLWKKNHPERIREIDKRWAKAHPEKVRERNRLWKNANPEKRREITKQWIKTNPERMKELYQRANREKMATPKGNLNNRMSVAIRDSLRGNKNGRSWITLVGFTIDQLKKHIEKRFLPEMSWENRNKWHIDHIIPLSAFNLEKPEDLDFKRAWSLKNLQPLWIKDNLLKSDKIIKSFQPNLIFQSNLN